MSKKKLPQTIQHAEEEILQWWYKIPVQEQATTLRGELGIDVRKYKSLSSTLTRNEKKELLDELLLLKLNTKQRKSLQLFSEWFWSYSNLSKDSYHRFVISLLLTTDSLPYTEGIKGNVYLETSFDEDSTYYDFELNTFLYSHTAKLPQELRSKLDAKAYKVEWLVRGRKKLLSEYPVRIHISPHATQRDILDYVRSKFDEIEKIDRDLFNLKGDRKDSIEAFEQLLLMARDLHKVYSQAPPSIKRKYIKLFWEKLIVEDRKIKEAVPTRLFQAVLGVSYITTSSIFSAEDGHCYNQFDMAPSS